MRKINWEKLTSSEFILALGAALGGWLTYLSGVIEPEYAVYITVGASVVFALARGLAKFNSDLKSGYKSREFWLAIAGIVVVVITAIPGVISPDLAVAAAGTIAAGYAVSRGFAKNPLDEVTGSGDETLDI